MVFSTKILGLANVGILLQKTSKDIKLKSKEGLKKATFFVEGEVKESIAGRRAEKRSVDTGRFLNSVQSLLSGDEGFVFSMVPYARWLEFGTSRFTARRHFQNSLARNKEKVVQLLKEEIKTI